MALRLRPYKTGDLESLYAISLATGSLGEDASALYDDPKLMGHIYSAPYAALSPQFCFVADDDERDVVGFAVGTDDTAGFEEQLKRDWWPPLRQAYPIPEDGTQTVARKDLSRIQTLHNPDHAPRSILHEYPAHVHMNLLPTIRGRGVGTALLELWLQTICTNASLGVHVGVNRYNENGLGFWRSKGFVDLTVPQEETAERTCWLGLRLNKKC